MHGVIEQLAITGERICLQCFAIEYQSDDVTKIFFWKLWDMISYT